MSGREKYSAARARALAAQRRARPADPQQAGRPRDARPYVEGLKRPCTTEAAAGGQCGHSGHDHDIRSRSGASVVRTACLIATADGPCGCPLYRPAPLTGGETTDG